MFEPCAPDRQLTGGPSGVVVTPPPWGCCRLFFVGMHSVLALLSGVEACWSCFAGFYIVALFA